MNSVLSRTTDIELEHFDAFSTSAVVGRVHNEYATAPMIALRPAFQRDDEEELHTSFEAAISERVTSLHTHLSRLSNSRLSSYHVPCRTEPLTPIVVPARLTLSKTIQQRILIACFGLMCTMIGFDLMGLLVLHLH